MIGVFDSGYGGLTVLKKLTEQLPEYSYTYLGDNAREPYGPHTQEEIFAWTLQGVEFLFDQGCELVVLACNTASAGALRRIQQEVLPKKYPDKKVLGILAPTVEMLTGVPWEQEKARDLPFEKLETVGVLATQATVDSHAYKKEIEKRSNRIQVIEQACPELTTMIVAKCPEQQISQALKKNISEMMNQISPSNPASIFFDRKKSRTMYTPDSVILGCTHYALIEDLIRDELPANIKIYEQGSIVAQALKDYLFRHPEIENQLDQGQSTQFLTTGDPDKVSQLGSIFFGQPIQFSSAVIPTKVGIHR